MKKTEQKVIEFISQHKLLEHGDKLLIAFSGGPDSVFALHFLSKYARKYKIDISAIHFNHGLRGKEADRDELFSKQFCEKYNFTISVKKLDVKNYSKQNKVSIEEAARNLRYESLTSVAKGLKCNKIVTAHNQSDNTETVLLNILSGTGISGFSGIPVTRGNIIRPFLSLTKKEIVEYLDKNNIQYITDSSNLKSDYKRNYLRNKIVPLLKQKINPSLDEGVFRSSKILESALPLLEKHQKNKLKMFVEFDKNRILIKITFFQSGDKAIQGELLKNLIRKNFSVEFKYSDFSKLTKLSKLQKGRSVQLSSNLIAVRESDSILIHVKESDSENKSYIKVGEIVKINNKSIAIEKSDREAIKFNSKGNIEFLDAGKLKGIFILRRWKNGDKFIPLGMSNYKKLSDFLTDLKLPSSDKKNQLVLLNRNNIVWIVGLRIDNRYRIKSNTNQILKVWVK
jgi:tRNA(Ile)-lysidine synthase